VVPCGCSRKDLLSTGLQGSSATLPTPNPSSDENLSHCRQMVTRETRRRGLARIRARAKPIARARKLGCDCTFASALLAEKKGSARVKLSLLAECCALRGQPDLQPRLKICLIIRRRLHTCDVQDSGLFRVTLPILLSFLGESQRHRGSSTPDWRLPPGFLGLNRHW
jgi:hypothetical protein